jgi:hypothetical protein
MLFLPKCSTGSGTVCLSYLASPGIKQPRREAGNLSSYIADDRNEWINTSSSLYAFMACTAINNVSKEHARGGQINKLLDRQSRR